MSLITADRVRELFVYDPETGVVTRKVNSPRAYDAGRIVGSRQSGGYLGVKIQGFLYPLHRVVFLHYHGLLPAVVDHINGNTSDNRIANLRAVSPSENSQNQRRAKSHNKCGMLGVSARGSFFIARIGVKSVGQKYLGAFSTPEEAHAVYLQAKREMHSGCSI